MTKIIIPQAIFEVDKDNNPLVNVTFNLPYADADGFAEDGDEPNICIADQFYGEEIKLIDLINEYLTEWGGNDGAEITAEWLRGIADQITKAGSI